MRPWVLPVTVAVSLVLHGLLVAWWWQRPASAVLPTSAEAVTVQLLAMAPPAAAPEPAAAETVQPEPEQPTPAAEPEMVLPAKPVKRKPPAAPTPPAPVRDVPATVAASSPAVAEASAAAPPPVTTARYDAAYLRNPAPGYPPLSRRLNEQGRVLLRVKVSADGQPLAVELKLSSGFARLDDAARKAVAQWRFVPARRGDTGVESWVEVPIQFSLK